jgi:hypothetical protein
MEATSRIKDIVECEIEERKSNAQTVCDVYSMMADH